MNKLYSPASQSPKGNEATRKKIPIRRIIQNLAYNICFLLLFTAMANAQYQISGTVTDSEGLPLNGATIQLLDNSKGTATNEQGKYTLSGLRPGTYFLSVSFVGFIARQKEVVLAENQTVDFSLTQIREQLSEVVVTANRRLENLQRTAASVTAIEAKQIEQLQVKTFGELNSIAPNFQSYDDGFVGTFTQIASRGLATINITPIIGLYVDDVPVFNTFSYPQGLTDLQSIEVLRGPQGTLYGRNALGGVIKVTTNPPTNQLSGFVNAGYGNLNAKEFQLGLNAPLVANKLFFRLNGNFNDRDGFVKNEATGNKFQNRRIVNGNAALRYFATDRLRLSLNYAIQQRKSLGNAYAIASAKMSFREILKKRPYKLNQDLDGSAKVTTHNAAFSALYDFDKFSLTAVTAYQKTANRTFADFDFGPADALTSRSHTDLNNISQEIRLASTAKTNLEWTSGIFLYRNNMDNVVNIYIGKQNPRPVPPAGTIRTDDSENTAKGFALFGQAAYALTEKLTVTGGLRYDFERSSATMSRTYNIPLPGQKFKNQADFAAISPKVSVSYKANEHTFVFANVARGFRPGGINQFARNAKDAPYKPEYTMNYELGFKSDLMNNRLRFNLTGFFIDYTEQQVLNLLSPTEFLMGIDNIGRSRSMGLELESQWVATKGLTFNANLGLMKTKVVDYTVKSVNPATRKQVVTDRSGNQLPVSPQLNGNINVNYIVPLTKKINFETSADYRYQSEVFWDISNVGKQEAYGLLNGRMGLTSKNYDVFLWGKNITDQKYFTYGFGYNNLTGASFGLPLTYGITLTAKF